MMSSKVGQLFSIIILLLFLSSANAAPFAYITNSGGGSVSVIDVATRVVVATIPSGFGPSGVSVSPSGEFVYISSNDYFGVLNTDYSGAVFVIDSGTNSVVSRIRIGGGVNPYGIAVSPNGREIYVSNPGSNNLSIVDVATRAEIATVAVGVNPQGVAFSPDGSKAYVTNYGNPYAFPQPIPGSISLIDVLSPSHPVTTISIPSPPATPIGIALSPTGQYIYVADQANDSLLVFQSSNNTLVSSVPVGTSPDAVSVSPDGSIVYVTSNTGTLTAISSSSLQVQNFISSNLQVGVSVTSDGSEIYVANKSQGTISVLDARTFASVATIPVGIGSAPLAFGNFITPTPSSIPTLSEWTQIALAFMSFGLVFWYQRRESI